MQEYGKIVLKSVEAQLVAASLGIIPNDEEGAQPVLEQLFTSTIQYVVGAGEQPGHPMCIFHDVKARNHINLPVEAIVPITKKIPSNETVWVYELPAMPTIASVVYQGSLESIGKIYQELENWIQKHQYKIIGSVREIYINYSPGGDDSIIEIQYPVEENRHQENNIFSWLCSLFNNQE